MKVEVRGLREFRSALRRVGPEWTKALQQENKAVAEEVAVQARLAYMARYRQRSGRGAASIRGLATQTRAQVAIGGTRTPYVLGQEFGSVRFKQFPARSSAGYFFYPAIRRAATGLVERYHKALQKVASRAFPGRGL